MDAKQIIIQKRDELLREANQLQKKVDAINHAIFVLGEVEHQISKAQNNGRS